MKRLRNIISARTLLLGISGIAAMVVGLVLYGITSVITGRLLTQQMAERWSDEKDASQISCFFSANAGTSVDSIEAFRRSLDASLVEASILNDSPNADARLWADAYSADGRITVKNDRATVSADAIGIGGDYFLFHPLKLLYGSYFSESDLNQDLCILDEDAAWQLFGSNNVAGMIVEIGGIPHVVAGVIEREDGRLAKAAGLDSTLIYVSYDTLCGLGSSNGINHYELVMPNPVKGYALSYVEENIGVAEKEVEIIENSTRYDLLKRFQVLGGFGIRSMNGKAIIYPYWENIARGYDDIVAVLTLFALLFLMYPTVLVLVLIVYAWKHKTWTAKSVLRTCLDRWEQLMEDVQARRLRKKKYKDRWDDEEEFK